jgi:hypothetical protein
MVYKILADITVALHLAWIIFLFLGALWGARRHWVKVFHLSGLGFAFLIQIFDWYCPLTHLEAYLRARHDPATAYTGDFIVWHLEQVVYLQVSRYVVVIGTFLLFAVNLLVYRIKWKGIAKGWPGKPSR